LTHIIQTKRGNQVHVCATAGPRSPGNLWAAAKHVFLFQPTPPQGQLGSRRKHFPATSSGHCVFSVGNSKRKKEKQGKERHPSKEDTHSELVAEASVSAQDLPTFWGVCHMFLEKYVKQKMRATQRSQKLRVKVMVKLEHFNNVENIIKYENVFSSWLW
jgi:hypothetical protein